MSLEPQSATKLGRAARKRGVKQNIESPLKGGETDAEKQAKEQADLMETAKMQLGVYCRKHGITDDDCLRIADRINYERSPKNRLRNPRALKRRN